MQNADRCVCSAIIRYEYCIKERAITCAELREEIHDEYKMRVAFKIETARAFAQHMQLLNSRSVLIIDMSIILDAETLRRIARMVGDPREIIGMRAVCREWRAAIPAPVIPRVGPRELLEWARKYGFEETARYACGLGARDLYARIDPTHMGIAQCLEMWMAKFAHRDEQRECKLETMKVRAIAHGYTWCIDLESLNVLDTVGRFADDDVVRATFLSVSDTCKMDFIISGAIEGQRRVLAQELLAIRLKTGRTAIGDYLSSQLLGAGEWKLHSMLRDYLSDEEKRGALEFAAESGDCDTCIYARNLDPEWFDFDGMLRGAIGARDDVVCRLAKKWIYEIGDSHEEVRIATSHDTSISRTAVAGYIKGPLLETICGYYSLSAYSGNEFVFAFMQEWRDELMAMHPMLSILADFQARILRNAIRMGSYQIVDAICKKHRIDEIDLRHAAASCHMCYEVMLRASSTH